MSSGSRFAVLLLLIGVVAPACGGSGGDTSPVVLGSGSIPATVPNDFPMPAGGVVGDTMIDRTNHKTEFSVQVGRDLTAVAQFYEIELVSSGYVVNASRSVSNQMWRIEFSQGELAGEVTINSLGGALSQVIVTLNVA